MREVRKGQTIRLRYAHYASGVLADPDTYTIEIDDSAHKNVVNAAALTKESTGIYYYDYTPPDEATTETGGYDVDVKFTTGTFVAGLREKDHFEVVKEVG